MDWEYLSIGTDTGEKVYQDTSKSVYSTGTFSKYVILCSKLLIMTSTDCHLSFFQVLSGHSLVDHRFLSLLKTETQERWRSRQQMHNLNGHIKSPD